MGRTFPRSLKVFQSTLPTRGSDKNFIPPRLPMPKFQSTLPTRGSDAENGCYVLCPEQFQSTLPTRGSDFLIHLDFQR